MTTVFISLSVLVHAITLFRLNVLSQRITILGKRYAMGQPQQPHTCETCGEPADDCYREGSGTGHSEHVCACADHTEGVPRGLTRLVADDD